MKKIKEILTSLLVSSMLVVPVLGFAGVASAQSPNIQEGLETGSCLNTTSDTCAVEDPNDAIDGIITTVINVFSLAVGVVSVIMIIVGGFKYITSSGDSAGVSSAKNTIVFAIVGLVIVALAQVIVRFVLGKVADS